MYADSQLVPIFAPSGASRQLPAVRASHVPLSEGALGVYIFTRKSPRKIPRTFGMLDLLNAVFAVVVHFFVQSEHALIGCFAHFEWFTDLLNHSRDIFAILQRSPISKHCT